VSQRCESISVGCEEGARGWIRCDPARAQRRGIRPKAPQPAWAEVWRAAGRRCSSVTGRNGSAPSSCLVDSPPNLCAGPRGFGIASKIRRRWAFGKEGAFSILELLVAMAVFAIVVVVLLSVADSAIRVTSASRLRMSADSASREALGRMAADFSAQLQRKDLPDIVEKRTGNDRMVFHAEVDGYGGVRGISRTSYLVSDHPEVVNAVDNFGRMVLLRGVEGVGWESGSQGLLFGSSNIATSVNLGTLDVAASDVFRLEFLFLMADGTLRATPPTASVGTNMNLLRAWGELSAGETVTGVMVALAALDSKSRALLPPNGLETLAGLLPDGVAGTDDILTQWEGALDAGNLPHPVLKSVRFYQRTFDLP